jgi:Spy/CpxP family protein refolding chaperone
MINAISWRNPKVLRVLLLVFLAGALSGAITYRVARIAVHAYAAPPVTTSLREKEAALAVLQRELNLTPAQTAQVSSIIDDYKRYYGNIQDQVEEVRATGKSRIVQVLDSEQRAKFEKIASTLR